MRFEDQLKKLGETRVLLLILALTFLVYINSLANGFVWDDWVLLVDNPAYKSLDLAKIFLPQPHYHEYLPLRNLSLALDAQVWGMRPFGFHLTNILIYLGMVAVLFRAVKNLSLLTGEEDAGFIAGGVTLIFALHPLHAEPVNFIISRDHMLAALFIFLSLDFLIRGILKGKDRLFFFSAVFFVMALFSKQTAVFYPVFLALLLFLFIPPAKLSLKRKILILLGFIIVDMTAVTIHLQKAASSKIMNENALLYGLADWKYTLSKALQIPFFYLWKFLVPYPLTVAYKTPFTSGYFILKTVLSGAAIMAIFYAAWRIRKKHALPALGVIWCFASLGPMLNILPTSPVVADRYAFMPVLGYALVAVYVFRAALSQSKYLLYIGAAAVVIFGIIIVDRNTDWKSDLSLWESALAVNPDMDRENLANALWARQQYDRALTLLEEERNRSGGYRYSLFQGKYLMEKGRYQEAIGFFRTSLAEGGDAWKENHFYLALAYEKTGADMPALEQYLKTVETSSLDPIGKLDKMAGEGVERIRNRFMPNINRLRDRALSDPADFGLQAETALLLQNLGLYEEAENFYLRALKVNSSNWEAWYNLGLVYMKLKRYPECIRALEQSLAINPDNKDAYNHIGLCHMRLKDYPRAARNFEAALKLDPAYIFPWFNLGRLYFLTGKREEARRHFAAAGSLAAGNPALQHRIDQYLKQME